MAASAPSAPGLLTMTMGWPMDCDSSWPAMRASVSLAEPGPNGNTNLIGLEV